MISLHQCDVMTDEQTDSGPGDSNLQCGLYTKKQGLTRNFGPEPNVKAPSNVT